MNSIVPFLKNRLNLGFGKLAFVAATALTASILNAGVASAQMFAAESDQPNTPSEQVLSTHRSTNARGQTVTSQRVRVYGWEQSVIKDDRNLGRWYWNPMDVTRNSYNRPQGVYAPKEAGHKYTKPVHVANVLPQQPPPPQVMKAAPQPSSDNQVSANLVNNNVNGQILNKRMADLQAERKTSAELLNKKMNKYAANRANMLAQAPSAPPVRSTASAPAPTHAPALVDRPIKIASYGGYGGSSYDGGGVGNHSSASATGKLLRMNKTQ